MLSVLSVITLLSVLSARLSPFLVAQRSFALPTGGASSASAMASSLKSLEELQACMEGCRGRTDVARGSQGGLNGRGCRGGRGRGPGSQVLGS